MADPPRYVRGTRKGHLMGDLEVGFSLDLEDVQLEALIQDHFEQFVWQPGTFETDNGPVHLKSGVMLKISCPYAGTLSGSIQVLITVSDVYGQPIESDQIDWSDAASYGWYQELSLSKPHHEFHIPKEALYRYTEGNAVHRSGDVFPLQIHFRSLVQPSGAMGPHSSIEGFNASDPVLFTQFMYGVRPAGFIPENLGESGITGTVAAYDASIQALADYIRSGNAVSHVATVPVPIQTSLNSSQAVMVRLPFSFPTIALKDSLRKAIWPSGMPTKDEFDLAYSDADKRTAAFSVCVMMAGSGTAGNYIENTRRVSQLLDDPSIQMKVDDQSGANMGEVYGAGVTAIADTVYDATKSGGAWFLDTAFDVLVGLGEFLLMALKGTGADGDWDYTDHQSPSWAHFLAANLPTALAYEASRQDGPLSQTYLDILNIVRQAEAEAISRGAENTVTLDVVWEGFFTGVSDGAHHHLTDAEASAIMNNYPSQMNCNFELVTSPLNPKVSCLAPWSVTHTENGVRKTSPKLRENIDYHINPRIGMLEGMAEAVPVVLIAETPVTNALAQNGDVVKIYAVGDNPDSLSVISRQEWPSVELGQINLEAEPYTNLFSTSTLVKTAPGYLFTGYQIGAFDQAVNDYAAADTFNLSNFIAQLGDADHRVGPQSGLLHFDLIPYNVNDSASALYNAHPTWWGKHTCTRIYATDGTSFNSMDTTQISLSAGTMLSSAPPAWTTPCVVYAGTIELTKSLVDQSSNPVLSKNRKRSEMTLGVTPTSLFSFGGGAASSSASSSRASSAASVKTPPVMVKRMSKAHMARYKSRTLKPLRAKKLKPAKPLPKPAHKKSVIKNKQVHPKKKPAKVVTKNKASAKPKGKGRRRN